MSGLSSSPAAIGTPHGPDATWRSLTDAGNAALARGDSGAALSSYEMALDEAERLFLSAREETAALLLAPMTLTISLSNLADLRRRADDRDGAFRLKWRAVERLLEIAGDRGEHPALRLNCVRHLKYALAFLAEDAASNPSRQAELAALINESRLVMDQVFDHLRSLADADDNPVPSPIRSVRH